MSEVQDIIDKIDPTKGKCFLCKRYAPLEELTSALPEIPDSALLCRSRVKCDERCYERSKHNK